MDNFPNIQNWQDTLAADVRWVFFEGRSPDTYLDILCAYKEYDSLPDDVREQWRKASQCAYIQGYNR